MMTTFIEAVEELNKLIEQPRQYWLLGAGASFDANIPLMHPLTKLVSENLEDPEKTLFATLKDELEDDCHVEHILSHVADLLSVADRSKAKSVAVRDEVFSHDELSDAYKAIVEEIALAVRYGYVSGDDPIKGTAEKPVIDISTHLAFIDALFATTANRQARSSITFFTTNYDTLLEDALALRKKRVLDGFSGGGVGFWDPAPLFDGDMETSVTTHKVMKLHGSVDWYHDKDCGLVRARYGSKYLSDLKSILIYPQASKYVETSKDPFSYLFRAFRNALMNKNGNVLCTAGYSFGDDHINQEILNAMSTPGNRSTLIAFVKEVPRADNNSELPGFLKILTEDKHLNTRVWVASNAALYCQGDRLEADDGLEISWWSMNGLVKFLTDGDVP